MFLPAGSTEKIIQFANSKNHIYDDLRDIICKI